MKKYSYDLEGCLVVREGQKDNVIYADAIDCIKERDTELSQKNTAISGLTRRYNDLEEECAWEINTLRSELARIKEEVERAYEKGFKEGESKQAILELQGRDRFMEKTVQPQIATLKAERDAIKLYRDSTHGHESAREILIKNLEAERDELRDALDTIEGMATDTSVDIQGIARKALNK